MQVSRLNKHQSLFAILTENNWESMEIVHKELVLGNVTVPNDNSITDFSCWTSSTELRSAQKRREAFEFTEPASNQRM